MKKFLFISFLLFMPLLLGAQWEWQRPLPQGNELYNVCFVDDDYGWAVGDMGVIVKTSNGGNSWDVIYSEFSTTLFSVCFTDTLNGWAVGYAAGFLGLNGPGIILHSTDGGLSWVEQDYGGDTYLEDVWFYDELEGWAVGHDDIILHTDDGGDNWEVQHIDEDHGEITTVYFVDSLNGWASGDVLLGTKDGGDTWNVLDSIGLRKICFIDTAEGWASDRYNIYHSDDGGITWNEIQSCPQYHYYSDLSFIDGNYGWAIVSRSWAGFSVYSFTQYTIDGGIIWHTQNDTLPCYLNYIHFNNPDTGFIVGEFGTIAKTYNGGEVWETFHEVAGNARIDCIDFVDADHGWASGDSSNTILHTSDGGNSWERQYTGISTNGFSFTDELNGWAVGGNGNIIHTTDGGNTWEPQYSGVTSNLQSICFVDHLNGWAVGSSNIIHTSDGGKEWEAQSSGNYNHLYDVFFVDENHGWVTEHYGAIPYYGFIHHTTDGGESWETQLAIDTAFIYATHFIDQYIGWAVGNEGAIFHTTNGGDDWLPQESGTMHSLRDVYFTNAYNGWIAGSASAGPYYYDNIILHTSNGGISWNKQFTLSRLPLFCVDFIDQDYGWIGGGGNTIIHTSNGGGPVSSYEPLTIGSPIAIHVYPNPAHQELNISLDDGSGIDEVRIYTLTGQQVMKARSVNGKIDISHLKTGMYIVEVTIENTRLRQKLLVQ